MKIMKHFIDAYGYVVTYGYNRIKVSVGSPREKVILLLGRKTSPSSIIEMKPLVDCLEECYTVVTLDYLGTGSSDNYHSKRTLENITSEIHEVMELMGYTKYTIAAVAYAGLYALYYSNRYADEVEAVIGIDAFVAEQNNIEGYRENINFTYYMWQDFHKSRFVQWLVKKSAAHYLKKSKSYTHSKIDIEHYSNNAVYMLSNMMLLDEYKCADENFKELEGIHFHKNIPVLFILSSQRIMQIHNWYDLHKKLLPNSNSKIIILKGGKNLHLTQPERLAAEIKFFMLAG